MSGANQPAERNGSDLCLQCGLCCNGAIFGFVPLDADELAPARQYPVTLVSDPADGATSIEQSCGLFQNGCCSNYGVWRPRVCDEYACSLLDAYLAGTRTLASCMEIIDRMRAATNQISSVTNQQLEDSQLSVDQLLSVGVVKHLRRKHFKVEAG